MSSKNNDKKTSSSLKQLKKAFLWMAVVILIGEFLFGALVILANDLWTPTLGKVQTSFLLLAVALFIGINNLTRIEERKPSVSGLAWLSLAANVVWLVIGILLIWDMVPAVDTSKVKVASYYIATGKASVWVKLCSVASNLGIGGFLMSNVFAIKETVKQVKPLKVAAAVCWLYVSVFAIIVTFAEIGNYGDWGKWFALSGLAGLAFVVLSIVALIVSRTNAKKEASVGKQISSEEMQSTIQEMVEKEVQARLAAEKKKETESRPPLQAEDTSGSVSQDKKARIETHKSEDIIEDVDTFETIVKDSED